MAETSLFTINPGYSHADEGMVRAAQLSLTGFKELYLQWLTPIYRYFYYRTGDAQEAEDLTSQVFLRVYEELPSYQNRGHFTAWLFTIVRHKAADFFRRRRPAVSLEALDPVDQATELLSQAVRADEVERLKQLIGALSEEEQELVRLRFVAGLSYRDIGDVFSRKEDAVRKSISRLLARLQSQLENRNE